MPLACDLVLINAYTLIFNFFAAPGGIIIQDGDPYKTDTCVFGLATDMEKVRAFEQVFVKLMRRYVRKSFVLPQRRVKVSRVC